MLNNENYEKIEDEIKKFLDKIYNTTSISQEGNYFDEIVKLISKIDNDYLISIAEKLNIFEKCVLYYKLPIEYKMNVPLTNSLRVSEKDRLIYWKEYKTKIKDFKYNIEEEYNKIIMMACILHVPIDDKKINETLLSKEQ